MHLIYGTLFACHNLLTLSMSRLLLFLFSVLIALGQHTAVAATGQDTAIIYPDTVLVRFLDSVGHLPSGGLMQDVGRYSDSLFYSQQEINSILSPNDMASLKEACRNRYMDTGDARRILPGVGTIIDSQFAGYETIPVRLYSFGTHKHSFTDFAILPGNDMQWDCDLYFFHKNHLLARHNIYHHYGLELAHYKDRDGHTVVYYKRNYQSGTGIHWYNYQFYKFYNNRLVPVLNEIASAAVGMPWNYRVRHLHATVLNTNPLTMKMVFEQDITQDFVHQLAIQRKDSVVVRYTWNKALCRYVPQYGHKLPKQQILTYYLERNELLFLNTNYRMLKRGLANRCKRKQILFYINQVKNIADNGYGEWD